MNVQAIIGIALVTVAIDGLIALVIHLIVRFNSRLGSIESVKTVWPDASKQFLEPHACKLVLWLIYGIGFNCLVRSFTYSLLQILGVLTAENSLKFTGEYFVSCICTFSGSFIGSTLYKIEEGSHPIVYSLALVILFLPIGLLMPMFDREDASIGTWVLWPVSIAALSLVASFIVFKFIVIPAYILSSYSLGRFEWTRVPATPGDSNHGEYTQEGSTQENQTLQGLIQRISTLQGLLDERAVPYSQTPMVKRNKLCERMCLLLLIFVFIYLPTSTGAGWIEAAVESDFKSQSPYLSNCLDNLAQLMDFFGYGIVIIFIQSQLVSQRVSVNNWGWYVVFSNLLCFLYEYLIDSIMDNHEYHRMGNMFIATEVLWVPFKYAAVGFIFTAAYYMACIRRARTLLNFTESHELEDLQTV